MSAAAVSLLAGGFLGLSLAAPPGPMNAVIAEESVRRGWRAGFFAGLGAMTADAAFFALALAGVVTVVARAPALRSAMLAAGGLLMLRFAYGAARGARGFPAGDGDGGGGSTGYAKALALALTNPYQVTWWLTAGVGLFEPVRVSTLGVTVTSTGGPPTVAGFFGGILVWIVAFPAALRAARDRVAAVGRLVAYGSAALLAWFGVVFLAAAL